MDGWVRGTRRLTRLLVGAAVICMTAGAATTAASAAPAPVNPTAAGGTPAVATVAAGVPSRPGWTKVWSDDFTGAAGSRVNTSNWKYDIGHGYPGGAGNWGTGEVEYMTDNANNVFLDGSGNLVIKALRDGSGNWTSGRIETVRTDFGSAAGGVTRIEASLKQPNVSGAAAAGYWPAFWALGAAARGNAATTWPTIGELDIMESINGRDSSFHTLHCGVNPGGPCNETTGLGSGEVGCGTCKVTYHTYAVELDRTTSPQQLRFYRDSTNVFTVRSNQMDATTWNNATNHGFFPIVDLAMGGGFPGAFGGGPTSATQPGVPLVVDYVAAFRR